MKANALFDALGGGEVTQKLIDGLQLPANVYIYGVLANQPLHVSTSTSFFSGLNIGGFYLTTWLATTTEDERKQIADNYSKYLKGDLSTKTFKEYNLKDIKEALELSNTRATEGKILLRP